MSHDELHEALNRIGLERKYPQVRLRWNDDTLLLGLEDEPECVELLKDRDWETHVDAWHGHYEIADEALDVGLAVLSGNARTAAEYRGSKMAAAWLEVFDDTDFNIRSQSMYLNPFDREEWELRRGEKWKVRRVHRRYFDLVDDRVEKIVWGDGLFLNLGQKHEFDVELKRGMIVPDAWMFDYSARHFGPPAKGLKWVQDRHQRYLFQVPVGWRMEYDEPKWEWPGILYFSPSGKDCLRVQTAFRPAEVIGQLRAGPQAPQSIVEEIDPPGQVEGSGFVRLWKLKFSNGEEEMLVYASIFGPVEKSVRGRAAIAFQRALAASRFVPWPTVE